MIGGQDIRKGKEWFVKRKQVEVYLPEKKNLFIGILKDTNRDTVREKETGKWSDLSSQLLTYGEIFFPTSAPFQRKRQKKSELWEHAWVLLVKMRIPGQEIFFGGLSFWFCLWSEYTP